MVKESRTENSVAEWGAKYEGQKDKKWGRDSRRLTETEGKIKRQKHDPAAPHGPLSSRPLMLELWYWPSFRFQCDVFLAVTCPVLCKKYLIADCPCIAHYTRFFSNSTYVHNKSYGDLFYTQRVLLILNRCTVVTVLLTVELKSDFIFIDVTFFHVDTKVHTLW